MKRKRDNKYLEDGLKNYMAVPVKQKLAMIEQLNSFFDRLMPSQNKKFWIKLQQKGF